MLNFFVVVIMLALLTCTGEAIQEIIGDKTIDMLTPKERTSLVFLMDNKLVTFLDSTWLKKFFLK